MIEKLALGVARPFIVEEVTDDRPIHVTGEDAFRVERDALEENDLGEFFVPIFRVKLFFFLYRSKIKDKLKTISASDFSRGPF